MSEISVAIVIIFITRHLYCIFSLYFTKERESDEGQVMGAYLKNCIFSMPFTFLAREIVLLTEEESPDTSDGGTIYKTTDSYRHSSSKTGMVDSNMTVHFIIMTHYFK